MPRSRRRWRQRAGLASPAPPAGATVPVPAAPVRPVPSDALLVESIVCAAAEALQSTPTIVRDVLRVAFARARALGMTTEEVDAALQPAPAAAPPKKAPKTSAGG
jgi:hypothetical protein